MKFVTIQIPVIYVDADDVSSVHTSVKVRAFVPDDESVLTTLDRVGRKLEEVLGTVDIGDET